MRLSNCGLIWVRQTSVGSELLSVIFGVSLIPIAAAICRLLRLSQIDTVFVLILIALNGLLIYYSQHNRMFALFEAGGALSILAFIYFLSNSTSRVSLSLLVLVNIIMVYSHYWGWFIILSEALICAGAPRIVCSRFLLSQSLVTVAFLPWVAAVGVAALREQGLTQQIAWMGENAAGATSYAFLFAGFDGQLDFAHATTLGIVLFFAPLSAHVIIRAKAGKLEISDPRSPVFWIIIIATPLVLTSIASYLSSQNLWGDRHLSVVAVPYYVFLGLCISSLRSRWIRVAIRCALAAWAIAASASWLAQPGKKFHWDELAKEIAARDAVVPVYASERFISGTLGYYLAREGVPSAKVEDRPDPREIQDRCFWYVYRNVAWHSEPPEAQFAASHYAILSEYVIRLSMQAVVAILVQTRSDGQRQPKAAPSVAGACTSKS